MDDARYEVGRLPKNRREAVVVSLSEYRGVQLVDVRIFADIAGDGAMRPTAKGVSLRIERLTLLIAELERARDEAERRGLIGADRGPT